ncbi:ERF family protein [Variovorax sp. NFACC27]|uniref:ERF family protein n=1 Tax=unclassified Variovorax TaxID=663243 RepID=UPI003AAB34B0
MLAQEDQPAFASRPSVVLPPRNEIATVLHAITAAAHDPSVDIDKMERLLSMHERMHARANEQKFNAAMTKAQAAMGPISADAVNPQTRSTYASYAQLNRALRPIYTKNGFALSFDTDDSPKENHIRVLCYVSHAAGHMRTYKCDMPADGKGAKGGDVMTKTHAQGSAMTYSQRYLLKLIFNVAIGETDDDGNGAGRTPGADDIRQATEADRLADGLFQRLQQTKTDAQAAALWAEGCVALAETKRRDLYDEFKESVITHRRKLKAGGRS